MSAGRHWSQEEVDEILRRAIERQQKSDAAREGTSHEDLLAAAREVGIDPAAVEAAAADLAKEKAPAATEQPPGTLAKRSPWPRLLRALASFAFPAAFLLALHEITGEFGWVKLAALGLGLMFVFESIKIFFPSEDDEAEEVRRAARRAERADRRSRRRARREAQRQTEREFEEAVEDGVQALLGIVAKNIRDSLDPKPRVRVEPPRVRVEVEEPAAEVEVEKARRERR